MCMCVIVHSEECCFSLSFCVCMSLAPVCGHMNRVYRVDYIIQCKRHLSCPHATSVKDVNEDMQKRRRLYLIQQDEYYTLQIHMCFAR